MMKKIIVVLMMFMVFAACQKDEIGISSPQTGPNNEEREEYVMNGISFEGKSFVITLDYTAGTGFDWLCVYQSGNVEIGNGEHQMDEADEPITGGSGNVFIRGHVSDDEDGLLILKYARPWEYDGAYNAFFFHMKDGVIDQVDIREDSNYVEMEFVCESFGEDWLGTHIPDSWEYEVLENDEMHGFAFRPKGEKEYMQVLRYPSFEYEKEVREEKIMITDKEYEMGLDENGKVLYLAGPDDMVCIIDQIGWQDVYFYQIIEIVDNVRFE